MVAIPEVRHRIVTTADGRLLRRVGSENQPLRADGLARFVREREERSGEDEPIADFDNEDVDLSVVNRALSNDKRPPIRRRSVSALDRALVDLGVSDVTDASLDPQPRRAVLLFARQLTRYVKGASIQVVRRDGVGPGPGPVSAREELDGPIPLLLERALAFIDAHTTSRQAVVGSHRETFAEYPPAVLREAILNALAHRDYNLTGATVDVTVWDDRIEIQSPGSLPGHITTENMRAVDRLGRRYGLDVERVRPIIDGLLEDALTVMPVTATDAWRAAEIRIAHYHGASCPLSLADVVLIACGGGGRRIATSDSHVLRTARREGGDVIPLPDSTGRRPD